MSFAQFFTQTNSESNNNVNWHTQLVQTKFSMGTLRLETIINTFTQLLYIFLGSISKLLTSHA